MSDVTIECDESLKATLKHQARHQKKLMDKSNAPQAG